jgi:hypothetical protein
MQITEIAYRRIFNLGNYESAQIEMRAALSPGEEPTTVIDSLAAEAKAWRKSKETTAQA